MGNRLPILPAQAADGPVPDDVLNAGVTVVADWARSPVGWASGGGAACGDRGRAVPHPPRLVAYLADGVARAGRLPLLGSLAYTPQADEHAVAPQQLSPATACPGRLLRRARRTIRFALAG
ncbi:hypothetical protein GCM10011428_48090 [Streptomyces violaceus]